MSNTEAQFRIVLRDEAPSGAAAEPKFGIHGANATGGVEQATYWIDTEVGNSLVVLANMSQVTHGTLVEGGSPATLIVLQFEFQPKHNHRRFKAVEIQITFTEAESGSGLCPEVLDITPKGAWSLVKSKKKVELSHSVGPSLEAGGGPAKATLGYKWQFKETSNKTNSARVVGMIRGLGSDRSKKNTVTWNLNENPDTEKGIPTLVQTAILLKRSRTEEKPFGEEFSATVKIHGEVDRVTGIQDSLQHIAKTMFGQDQKGEDVIFNPELNIGAIEANMNLRKQDMTAFRKFITLQDGEEETQKNENEDVDEEGEDEDEDI
jgi:hypothetical protein